jgi:hypothetical protein
LIRTVCTLATSLALAAVLLTAAPLAAEAGTSGHARPAPRTIRTAYTTGYTFFDNTPPGSPAISHPVRHRHAAGVGTYRNPITIAVGHRIRHGRDILDYKAGTRMYLPHVRRYFIVEDTCGDGPRPQRGPCHDLDTAPRRATTWVDLWVGGKADDRRRAVQRCASKITDGDGHKVHTIIVRPRRGYPVVRGPLFQDGRCTKLYPRHLHQRSTATGR